MEKDIKFAELDSGSLIGRCLVETSNGWDGLPLPEIRPASLSYPFINMFAVPVGDRESFAQDHQLRVVTRSQLTLLSANDDGKNLFRSRHE